MRLILSSLIFAFCVPAFATTFQFAGVMDDGDIPSGVSIGDPFSGTFTLDPTTPPEPGATLVSAEYHAVTALSVTINGAWTATVNEPAGARGVIIDVPIPIGNPPPDRFRLISSTLDGGITAPLLGGFYSLFAFQLELIDSSNTALAGIGLPNMLDINDFNAARVKFELLDASTGFTFDGTINAISRVDDSVDPTPVPLPASVALLLLGLVGLFAARRDHLN